VKLPSRERQFGERPLASAATPSWLRLLPAALVIVHVGYSRDAAQIETLAATASARSAGMRSGSLVPARPHTYVMNR
jgi:hypothetical protein